MSTSQATAVVGWTRFHRFHHDSGRRRFAPTEASRAAIGAPGAGACPASAPGQRRQPNRTPLAGERAGSRETETKGYKTKAGHIDGG